MLSTDVAKKIKNICKMAKEASVTLSQLTSTQKEQALLNMAKQLQLNSEKILNSNQKDLYAAKDRGLSAAFLDRLTLTKEKIAAMSKAMENIAELPDPVGQELKTWTVENGLTISRVAIPIGVIAIIYESRPNVTADAAALCLKSGNAVILRGGSDSVLTNKAIVACLHAGLAQAGLPSTFVQYLPTQDRSAIDVLLQMDEYVDVVIPRGGKSLIQRIRDKSRIPVFSHLEGICHTYIHKAAQLDMAINVLMNAKMRRTGICGATETLLIDKEVAKGFLPKIIDELEAKGCEVRGCETTQAIDKRALLATNADWSTEYLDTIISVKVVDDIKQAIEHIYTYGSSHTEAIITDDNAAAQQFMKKINSAIVMHNCSTQFADGGEFGMGAEIGIATGTLHARGPVGVEQLTTFKYVVEGNGQVRS